MTSRRARRGIQAVDVAVAAVVLVLLALLVLAALPRQREVTRTVTCERNLAKIGIALAIYDHDRGQLPPVPELRSASGRDAPSPLAELLAALEQPDFATMDNHQTRPPPRERPDRGAWRLSGLICQSDPVALATAFSAPTSYRATTGSHADGHGGAFEPGRVVSLADVEAADGTAYTAGFSERLLGDGKNGNVSPRDYARVPGPVDDAACNGDDPVAWRGDAGSSWAQADWVSTLYNHALPPNATPSCVAADGRSARMGASSGHVRGVNVLLLDLSVKVYTPKIDPKIWRALADLNDSRAQAPRSPSPSAGGPDRSR